MDPSLSLLPVVWSQRSMNFLKMQIIQDKSKPTRVAMIWLRLKVNRTRLRTAAHFARPVRSMLSPYYFQAPASQATHEVCCNHCFPHTRSLGFVARGRNAWPSPKRPFFQHWLNTGHVLSSWCFHRIIYRGYERLFLASYGNLRCRPKAEVTSSETETAQEKSLGPRYSKYCRSN